MAVYALKKIRVGLTLQDTASFLYLSPYELIFYISNTVLNELNLLDSRVLRT